MQDPVAAVPEAAATGEIAAIFADIRGVLGVGVVNLIWRHLATLPGALSWAWTALRPCYQDGRLAKAATQLPARLQPLPLAALPMEVLAAAGLDASARAGITGVLAAYGRTNPLALLALTALRHGQGTTSAAPPHDLRMAQATAGLPALALPPLPGPLPPALDALVWQLNAFGARPVGAHPPILATMYRHLAHWPAYLALAHTQLAPAAADDRLAQAIATCRSAAREIAATLPIVATPPDEATALALDRFGDEVLPRMVVIAGALSATQPPSR